MTSSTFNSASPISRTREATPAGSRRPAPHGRLRLTRRGRIVLIGLPLLLLAAVLLTVLGFFTSPAKASSTRDSLAVTSSVKVTVGSGQTLWAIAGAVDPQRDPRDVVADIVELNHLDTSVVRPGQVLFVPSAA
ncbi:LysM peptidoglycan-binding domain-containing protein [Paenarthrobacter sp. DKR-5]|uniref:LysM peptidoglycan-binding domain-containing protein n=1 Tax=Paenarthrobacter sp. DKR-5 TaxID=2835535 RepID=UPI001BDC7A5E|nr:LysM peptidoglycan-binding domain-containing protein [Paenarthrobacter sp. DKR-5]MBT1002739.1 LysM peptidoglycan-binding domain-containing protein [Paenarthrobacter sp. DKR-5]